MDLKSIAAALIDAAQMNQRIKELAEVAKNQQDKIQSLSDRLLKVETALEMATNNRFRAHQSSPRLPSVD